MKFKLKPGDFIWIAIIILIFSIFFIPVTKEVYESFNGQHPFILGFFKFMILASMGELLALRLTKGVWKKTKGFYAKAIAWGIIGITVTFMFKLFPIGVDGLIKQHILIGADGLGGKLIFGIYTSLVVNLVFGPVFMACHRITDTIIETWADGEKCNIVKAVEIINWPDFLKFVVGKTVPFFWIPAHTITFLLSENYRILFAAFLSIALGIILTIAKNRKLNNC